MVYVFPIERGSQKAIIAGAVVFSILPVAAVILRIIARSKHKDNKLDLSDWLIILSCIVAVGYQGLAVACVAVGGMGFHTTEIMAMAGTDSLTTLLELVTAVVIFWSLSLGLTKLSILALYSKIFSVRSFILLSQACAVFVVVWAMILFIGAFVICTPVQYNWDKFSVVGTCGDVRMLWAVTGGLNIFSDLVIMLLPMPYLYGLSLQTYKKVGLMATFGIGLAVCIVSAVRLAEIIKIDMNDFAFSGGIALMFSALEPCLLVTAACIPLLRPLVSRKSSRGLSSSYASGYAGGKSKNNTGNNSRKGGFSELQDDDGSTRQLHIGQSKYGGDATAATDVNSVDSSDRVGNHHADLELKHITIKRDWRVEESPV
ncbi:hypothetical protein PFICI_13169 [Pestalotiopsis fici W106-1]|uniref:Rhodopsin domain-containing protein n=1 Tax=Pestalotiopsis fici (strain W106-1 / CGMCC3.15140) TaxID=1229662 RepID=W3WL99_PESFW|nr:uncharacterized protein PFICI_13169 [Pestalotiopsis fici W106-1]ETS74685.1 hypothetical protein PFICI_13169 [Pestalotiopsis fici W106-1]